MNDETYQASPGGANKLKKLGTIILVGTLYKIDAVMDGALDEIIDALATADQAEKLKNAQ